MIRMTIEIDEPSGPRIDAGGFRLAGVKVETEPFIPADQPGGVGPTWAGICMAINYYMRERGARGFDCWKQPPGVGGQVNAARPIWRGWRCLCDWGNRHSDLFCIKCGKPKPCPVRRDV